MQHVLTDRPVFDDATEFVAALNKARLAAGKAWIAYQGMVARREVRIKTYGTGYLQILQVDGRKHAPPMDMNVSAWKAAILKALA